jgi:hypothetical protein
MTLLQNPNSMSYCCIDGSVSVDHLQHREILNRLELWMALIQECNQSSPVGVASEALESEETMSQILKAARENRHYPSLRSFHVAWRCNFHHEGDVSLMFALIGWTHDVSFALQS